MAFSSHKIDGQKKVSQIHPDRQNSRKRKMTKQIEDTLKVSCHDNLIEYLVHSTLHGLRYVGDQLISRFERIFFAIAFVLVVGLSIFFISVVWEKWHNKPLIIALSSNEYSIKELPFPAVTICSMNQARRSIVKKYSKSSAEFAVVKSLCKPDSVHENNSNSQSAKWSLFRKVIMKVRKII